MKTKLKTRALELKGPMTVTLWAVHCGPGESFFSGAFFLWRCDHIKQLLTRKKEMPLNRVYTRKSRGNENRRKPYLRTQYTARGEKASSSPLAIEFRHKKALTVKEGKTRKGWNSQWIYSY